MGPGGCRRGEVVVAGFDGLTGAGDGGSQSADAVLVGVARDRSRHMLVLLAVLVVSVFWSAGSSAAPAGTPAYVWGANSSGQLGVGGVAHSSSPVPVGLPAGAVDVQGGDDFVVVLTSSGEIWTWGGDAAGQLGIGGGATALVPQRVALPGGARVVGVAVGASHVLAVADDGRVFAWGGNWHGQLGDGSTANRAVPVEVAVPGGAVSVSAGNDVSLAVGSSGVLYAWGQGDAGQLGGGTADQLVPTAVDGAPTVVAADAGVHQTVAVTASGGLLAWGRDMLGRQLPVPIPVDPSLGAVTAVAVGDNHVAALTDQGVVVTFGDDTHGQLGDGDVVDPDRIATPGAVSFPGAAGRIVAVSAAGNHTLALTSTGQVFGWGGNAFGEVGVGGNGDVTTPTLIAGLRGAAVTGVYTGRYVSAVVVTTGVPAALVVSPSTAAATPGEAVQFDVQLLDAFGNVLGTATGARLTVGAGTCSGWSCAADAAGVHPVQATFGSLFGVARLTVQAEPPPTTAPPATTTTTIATVTTPPPTEPATPTTTSVTTTAPAGPTTSTPASGRDGRLPITGGQFVVIITVALSLVAAGVLTRLISRRARRAS